MSESPAAERAELEASFLQSKDEFQTAVVELKEVARDTLTPGEVLQRRRYVWLAGAFAVGVLLARKR